MEVLLFILQKGGVGKTTSAAALASILTQVHKKRVLLVSMDPQRNLDIICGAPIPRGSEQPSMYDVLKGEQAPRGHLCPDRCWNAGAGVQSDVSVDGHAAAVARGYRNLCDNPTHSWSSCARVMRR